MQDGGRFRGRVRRTLATAVVGLLAAACAGGAGRRGSPAVLPGSGLPGSPRPATGAAASAAPVPLASLLARLDGEDLEDRYAAALALARHDSPVVRARLRDLLRGDEPMLRNAAARSLADLGEEDAAAELIANLHRDRRTYVTMDALWHLRALYGTDLCYDPDRGYRHQTERQEEWWTWWQARGGTRPGAGPEPDPHVEARPALARATRAYADGPGREGTPDAEAWAATQALWTAAAEIAPSRRPEDVAAVADAFAAMSARWPANADLANNLALAALNDGRAEEALAAYGRARALVPEDASLANDQGILLQGMGRLAEAEAAYREAIRLAPEDDVARSNLGDALAAQGRRAEAVAAYREAERLAPEKWWYHRLWVARLEGGERVIHRPEVSAPAASRAGRCGRPSGRSTSRRSP